MNKMFKEVRKTWSPVVGCLHSCVYCWARKLAEGRLKHTARFQDGFRPQISGINTWPTFRGGLIFVSSMGDMWGDWVRRLWIELVLMNVSECPKATFLFLTKNPERYLDFLDQMPPNVILGATVESNEHYPGISKAPPVYERLSAMEAIKGKRTMLSIEPIMDFDLYEFGYQIKLVAPEFVYIGYNNYPKGVCLPEPTLEKTQALIEELRLFTEVRIKTLREPLTNFPRSVTL